MVSSRGCSEPRKPLSFRSEPIAPSTRSPSCMRYLTAFMSLQATRKAGNGGRHLPDPPQCPELTRVGEREIHEVILSCTRARRQLLSAMPAMRPTLH